MRLPLKLHPDSRCIAVGGIDVDVAREGSELSLSYIVRGRIAGIRLPPVATPARVDELWRHTCLEAFVRADSSDAYPVESYYEFNFAPSTQWAAYWFGAYREGMSAADEIAPHIDVQSHADSLAVRTSLVLPRLPSGATWRLGLAAVIEETSGERSYWALSHAPGAPDFHHPSEFVCDLPPSEPE